MIIDKPPTQHNTMWITSTKKSAKKQYHILHAPSFADAEKYHMSQITTAFWHKWINKIFFSANKWIIYLYALPRHHPTFLIKYDIIFLVMNWASFQSNIMVYFLMTDIAAFIYEQCLLFNHPSYWPWKLMNNVQWTCILNNWWLEMW